jgi:flavin reductase (DIM6/NTAB) family NADH-FMN oxidoreductase RutF
MDMTTTRPLTATTAPAELRRAFSCFPSGVAAVCAELDGAPVGMAVSSFTSVSLEPPLVSICIDRGSRTWPLLATATRLGVSILANGQHDACRQLAAKDGNRFEGLQLETTPDRAVFVIGASAWLDCVVHDTLEAGDHQVILLQVDALSADLATDPLVFHASRFHSLIGS